MDDGKKLEGLDGLRGLAALIVLAHHALHRAGIDWFAQGYLAVDLFFMLSGFVIALAYENRLRNGLGILNFTRIRIVRLYPLLALGALLGAGQVAVGVYDVPNSQLILITQLLLIPALWVSGPLFPLNGVQWSLFFELAVNVFHAIINPWLGRVALGLLVIGSALALALTSRHYGWLGGGWSADTFPSGFTRVGFGYFAGVALFRMYRSGRLQSFKINWVIPAVALPALIVTAQLIDRVHITDVITVVVAFPILVIVATNVQLTGKARSIALWLGAVSYPIYALQIAVAMPAKLISLPDSPFIQAAYWTAISLLTIILSSLALRYFDEPMRRWLRRKIDAPRPTSTLETAP